ncbi:nucleotide-binding universal stress UspA family protein [Microlunatus panaciterrae]|uniref:Nucleotide-binding universal stress UspA family protein n=1 Tax=Microlunatus panaciterrae TaxID=400768 RepID=A0ABS2RF86_9ACTN|nr:universal stress protein [Microlunatus panaciterrae]MBM7797669.1 nucleotide-binding universal stress UspA family protein [Microlunatus panaciterrae]
MASREVVVGIDDSPSGRAALRWAVEYARATDRPLHVLHVITPMMDAPVVWSPGFAGMAAQHDPATAEVERAKIRTMFNQAGPKPAWQLEFVQGPAGLRLVGKSEHASLLVIGTHEHVGLGRILQGSVSHYCLSHAQCPVVAVPPTFDEAGAQHDVTAHDMTPSGL